MKTKLKKITVLLLIIVAGIFFSAKGMAQDVQKTDTVKILTSAVCGSCKARIEKNVAYEKGVTDVVLDVDTKVCTIVYKTAKTDPDKLRLAISKIGYDADSVPADPVAYEKLPPCCKKGGM
jgi:periplasmic mercuric ion binding protein